MQRLRIILFLAVLFAMVSTIAAGQYRGPYSGPKVSQNWIGIQLGMFAPDGDSDYWNDKELEFTGRADDFEDFSGGINYQRFLSERLALLASASYFEGDTDQSYIDFVDQFGAPITHTTTLEIATFEIGLLFRFLSREAPVIPYVGAAGGLHSWRLEESGDFIDFGLREPEIFTTSFSSEGDTFGYSWFLGLEIPLAENWSVSVEAKWRSAEDELGDDFQGFGTLDLSGQEYLAGMSWGF